MSPTISPVVLFLELVCGSVRALVSSLGGSVVAQAVWLLAALLPAAYWAAEKLVVSSWDNPERVNDSL
jgi:hypothetical protein